MAVAGRLTAANPARLDIQCTTALGGVGHSENREGMLGSQTASGDLTGSLHMCCGAASPWLPHAFCAAFEVHFRCVKKGQILIASTSGSHRQLEQYSFLGTS